MIFLVRIHTKGGQEQRQAPSAKGPFSKSSDSIITRLLIWPHLAALFTFLLYLL